MNQGHRARGKSRAALGRATCAPLPSLLHSLELTIQMEQSANTVVLCPQTSHFFYKNANMTKIMHNVQEHLEKRTAYILRILVEVQSVFSQVHSNIFRTHERRRGKSYIFVSFENKSVEFLFLRLHFQWTCQSRTDPRHRFFRRVLPNRLTGHNPNLIPL